MDLDKKPLQCPTCGLLNPPSAERCDCGHNFDAGSRRRNRDAFRQDDGDRSRELYCPNCREFRPIPGPCRLCGSPLKPRTYLFTSIAKSLMVGGGGLLLLAWSLGWLGMVQAPPERPSRSWQPKSAVYAVRGTCSTASLTYQNEMGAANQQQGKDVPWSLHFAARTGDFLYVSAQCEDDSDETIEAEVSVDGETVESSSSSGRFVIASASGVVR